MTTRLELYNRALRYVGQPKIASLSEESESRYVLDDVWDEGAIDSCLEQGLWNFAMRTISLSYSPSVTTPFGYSRAFDIPSDWIRTYQLSIDENFITPLDDFQEATGYWLCNFDDIYIRYVSNDSEYGNDLSRWPKSFERYVAMYMANEASPRLRANGSESDRLDKDLERALYDAKAKDAVNTGTKYPPKGAWVLARRGSNRDVGF